MALRAYLQGLLDHHIEKELPKVRSEIKNLMDQTNQEIYSLGDERSTVADIRTFLTKLSMRFNGFVQSALNGTYYEVDSVFFGELDSTRLRARVQDLNSGFSDSMRISGAKRKVVDRPSNPSEELGDGQLFVTEEDMKEWVKKVLLYSINDWTI